MKRFAVMSILVALCTVPGGSRVFAQGGEVTLDHVDGLYAQDTLQTGVPITFYIRYTNNTGYYVGGMTNGFRVFSPDGATWTPASGQLMNDICDYFDLVCQVDHFNCTGNGADTVAGSFGMMMDQGIPNGYSDVVLGISTLLGDEQHGKTICIDSCLYLSAGIWWWAPGGPPSWSGPHCFAVKCGGCCIPPIRGNVDYDPGDVIDISDLVYLVDYMFNGGPAPPCLEEADVDGSGGIDISDLVFLVDYMFAGGPPPVACP